MGRSLLTCFSNDLCHGRGRWLWAAKTCLCHEPAYVTGKYSSFYFHHQALMQENFARELFTITNKSEVVGVELTITGKRRHPLHVLNLHHLFLLIKLF
jgi:hypothetical protein